jgi:hypothetical protein
MWRGNAGSDRASETSTAFVGLLVVVWTIGFQIKAGAFV